MKILLIADTEEKALWDHWSDKTAERLSDVGLILSAGDLSPKYLEFLVTMMNVPLVYVRGNHDGRYDSEPPQGCIDADCKIIEAAGLRILGLGGSMRYKSDAADMYTEREMMARVRKAELGIVMNRVRELLTDREPGDAFDILLTHAPCKGFGDIDDLPHTGFECFNYLLERYKPKLHCYGHVHREYGGFVFGTVGSSNDPEGIEVKGFRRQITHPSGATLVNGSGYIVLEI